MGRHFFVKKNEMAKWDPGKFLGVFWKRFLYAYCKFISLLVKFVCGVAGKSVRVIWRCVWRFVGDCREIVWSV